MLFCQIVKKICAIKVATTTPPMKFSIDYGTGRYETIAQEDRKKRLMVISVTPQRPTNKKTNKQSIKFFITLTDASVKTNQPKIVINKMLNVTVDSKN